MQFGRDTEIIQTPDARWTAVHTKPRTEKVLAEYCERHALTAYLPLRRQAKRYQRRTVVHFVPMFSGYIFAQLHEDARSILLRSHKVVHILPVDATQENVLIEELRGLQILERQAADMDILILPTLQPGTPVTVQRGPFQGMTGIVERRKDKVRVTINVELLGHAAAVDIDVGDIEPDP